MAEVRFEHVTKSYTPDTNVISDLNLVVKNAEFLVLVGPSGCGKSTALRMIAGLESITEGDLFIGDRRVNDIEPKDRDIAMVFQNYALYPHMTVYDNLAISLKLRHLKRQEIGEKEMWDWEYLRRAESLRWQRQRVALGGLVVSAGVPAESRSPISTRSCACRHAPRSLVCTRRLAPPSCMLRTIWSRL